MKYGSRLILRINARMSLLAVPTHALMKINLCKICAQPDQMIRRRGNPLPQRPEDEVIPPPSPLQNSFRLARKKTLESLESESLQRLTARSGLFSRSPRDRNVSAKSLEKLSNAET